MARDALLDMFLKDVSVFPLLDREQEYDLGRRIRAGDQAARQELIQCNQRLVVSVARHYEHQGMPILDVIEEGNLGLMRAVDRYDPSLECRFSTYAVHWIKQSIRRSLLEKVKNIRVPAYMAELVLRWKRFARENPGVTEVEAVVKALRLPNDSIKLLQTIMQTSVMSSSPVDAEEVSDLSAFFVDTHPESDPESVFSNRENLQVLQARLAQIPIRDAEVLRYRYGMDNFPIMTLEEIGHVYNLTRERVRQIEAKAIKRLRELIPSETVL